MADVNYGHFVPEAQFAYGLKPHDPAPGHASYHLGADAAGRSQKSAHVFHPSPWPQRLASAVGRVPLHAAGNPLLLAAVTLEQSGPHISPLFYGGKMVRPYPDDAPAVPPSPLEAMKDRFPRALAGWRLELTQPILATKASASSSSAAAYDASSWKTMAVPSQWYVKGLDYNGAVWFRREIQVPAAFPGSVVELNFGGVDYEARVWVNGIYVGRHIGAYTSFKINVTSALHKGAANLVVVRWIVRSIPAMKARKP